MKAVVQRVSRAAVRVDGQTIGEIGRGLLVLLGIGKTDTEAEMDWMIAKLLALRIFPDDAGKMNRSVTDTGGALLIVSQFTLYGVLEKGTRPSFSDAMPPADAEKFYHEFMKRLRAATTLRVEEGRFAAMMDVELVNDGPVTIVLQTVGQPSRLSLPIVGQASRLSTIAPRTTGTVVPLVPFDPSTPVEKSERHLPHWQQAGCSYFVTFRLADSLPQTKLAQWRDEQDAWLRAHPNPLTEVDRRQFHERFTNRIQHWLDQGQGSCLLRQPAVADLVESAIRHFDGQRYQLGAYVIMPNHVHLILTPLGDYNLPDILHTWQSVSAHEINKLINQSGPVWQHESFDHLIRTEEALRQFEEYIHQNPLAARLARGEYRCHNGQPGRLSHEPRNA